MPVVPLSCALWEGNGHAYLLHGVAWPKAVYRFGWGPASTTPVRFDYAQICDWVSNASGAPTEYPDALRVRFLMEEAHRANITGLRHAFSHVGATADSRWRSGRLRGVRRHRDGCIFFAADRDCEAFNARFNAAILTESRARSLLEERKARVPPGYRQYAPIDFSGGVTVGRIASTDSGTGRWEFFNRHVLAPLVVGKRVLDLGSNNASMPLMM
jgi:hypothetical protein